MDALVLNIRSYMKRKLKYIISASALYIHILDIDNRSLLPDQFYIFSADNNLLHVSFYSDRNK